MGDKGRKRERERKDCHIDLVILPAMVGGDMGRRVTQKKTGAPCEEGEHRAAIKLAEPHKEKTTQALCLHVYVRSLERDEEGLKWRYSRQSGSWGYTEI